MIQGATHMGIGMYILNSQGEPEKCDDTVLWGRWMENSKLRRVAEDFVADSRVSTVFLGLDHSYQIHGGPPILYETMIFGGPQDGFQERYETREDAVKGHAMALEMVSEPKTHHCTSEFRPVSPPPDESK